MDPASPNPSPGITKTYTNGEITVVWKPAACIHSKLCWTQLFRVFNPKARPWVNMAGAGSDRIAEQVDRCPSKALTYYQNAEFLQPKTI
ncbi:(4Fe-4S)-binding protein [Spirosoma taeanense]|uniref:(4Fe-4S)-binding protein n=1 Tax=Spirosoma taeanense TaxID=2735870 RepID=A0A6M5Y7V4_9BACT|nr:(4Fe-4S)-binding protein [Spirosoma taeanense]QJW89341.1 (4Fe-4S)-binding protein [Spirosoma taeanense]